MTLEKGKLTGVNHVAFFVSDADRSLEFYRDLIGMRVVHDRIVEGSYIENLSGVEGAKMRIVYVEPWPGLHMELVSFIKPPARTIDLKLSTVGLGHLAMNVDDIWALYHELSAKGVRFKSEPQQTTGGPNERGWAVHMYDPDGIVFEFIEPPPAAREGGSR